MDDAAKIATENTIRRSIKTLLAARDLTAEELAPRIGMPKTTLYRRLAAKGLEQAFRAHEVQAVADYFGVPVGDLYGGLGGLVGVGATGTDGVAGNVRFLPRQGANGLSVIHGQGLSDSHHPALRRIHVAGRHLFAV